MPKGFGYGGESANQEKKNLNKDMPVVKQASWMSKHSMAAGSPVAMGGSYKGSPMENGPGDPDPKSGKFKVGASGRPVGIQETLGGGYTQPGAGIVKAAQESSGVFDPSKSAMGEYKGFYRETGTGKPTQDPSKAYGYVSHSGEFTRFGDSPKGRQKTIKEIERQKKIYMQKQARMQQYKKNLTDYAKAGGVIKPDPKSGK